MKSNPCFQCICNPVCRLKVWTRAITECETLFKMFVHTGCPNVRNVIILDLESKKFFEMKNLGPA